VYSTILAKANWFPNNFCAQLVPTSAHLLMTHLLMTHLHIMKTNTVNS